MPATLIDNFGRRISGAEEALDRLIAGKPERHHFDIAATAPAGGEAPVSGGRLAALR